MKTTNKVIVAVLFVFGMQLIAVEPSLRSRRVDRGVRKGCKAIGRGFTAIMSSGIDFDELNRKIRERHEKTGYSEVAAE
jgi:hypothetical protein